MPGDQSCRTATHQHQHQQQHQHQHQQRWNQIDFESEDTLHASLDYAEVQANGPPARPIEFPTPTVRYCQVREARVLDHRSRKLHDLKGVIVPSRHDPYSMPLSPPSSRSSLTPPQRFAYLPKKKIAKSAYGTVRLCIVLQQRPGFVRRSFDSSSSSAASSERERQKDDLASYVADGKSPTGKDADMDDEDIEEAKDRFGDESSMNNVEWESTDRAVVVKTSLWSKIHTLRGHHLEDPIKEVSSLQYLGNYHPHVAGAYECLQDEDYLFTVMPYYSGGDLFGCLRQARASIVDGTASSSANDGPDNTHSQPPTLRDPDTLKGGHLRPSAVPQRGFEEERVRKWFREILLGLFHLQKKGVCHRDICLENILLNERNEAVIVDFGLSLRIPYTDVNNYGHVTDASSGPYRRLMKNQGQCGTLLYAAPEIVDGKDAFDAFAVDLWAAAVVLFVLLVGLAPFKWAHPTDKRFLKIAKGGLRDLFRSLHIDISNEACDLLQGMLWRDPQKRYTLAEVMQHPWVMGEQQAIPPVPSLPPRHPRDVSQIYMMEQNKPPPPQSPVKQMGIGCGKQKVTFTASIAGFDAPPAARMTKI